MDYEIKSKPLVNPMPNIDPRVRAVDVSKLRDMNSTFLRNLGDLKTIVTKEAHRGR